MEKYRKILSAIVFVITLGRCVVRYVDIENRRKMKVVKTKKKGK